MEDMRLRARTQFLQLAALFVGTAVRAEIPEMPAYQYYNGTNCKIDHLPQQTTITRWQVKLICVCVLEMSVVLNGLLGMLLGRAMR